MIINQIAQGGGGTTPLAIYRTTDANGKILPPDTFMDLGNATDVGDHGLEYAFVYSTLTTADLSKLTAVSGESGLSHCFHWCPNLTSVDVSNIEILTGSGCMSYFVTGCSAFTSITFNKLKTINANSGFNYTFRYSGIQNIYFPVLESVGYNNWSTMLSGITGCTIHLPTGLDPTGGSTVISSLQGYPNFGGTNTVLAFDL